LLLPGEAALKPEKKLLPVCQEGRYGYIERTGHMVIPPRFDSAMDFFEERARVRVGDRYGFIDEGGKVVVPAKFSRAGNFAEGRAAVKVGERYGYIDKTGKFVWPAGD
jgi:hypothetical protein